MDTAHHWLFEASAGSGVPLVVIKDLNVLALQAVLVLSQELAD